MNTSERPQPIVVRTTRWHALFDLGRTQGHHLSQTPGFPKKIVLGRMARGFLVSELEQWAREQAERE